SGLSVASSPDSHRFHPLGIGSYAGGSQPLREILALQPPFSTPHIMQARYVLSITKKDLGDMDRVFSISRNGFILSPWVRLKAAVCSHSQKGLSALSI
ncbi:MAG: hypothetical protein PVG49_03370, partial [Desulfobacteraceae bacterium]